MNHELTRKLAAAVEAMPAFPNSVRKIIELTSNIACPPKDLVQVIDTDPVLALRLLRVVNSSYYGLASRLTSVSHAVVFMGINTIKNLALSVAGIAKQLAARTADADPNDCFMAGLLHDFGKVVFAQCMPAEFALALEMSKEYDLSLHLTLRKVAGVDHASVGAALVEKWRFPEPLVETIRYQYGPDLPDTPGIAVVFAANQISKKLGLGFAGNDGGGIALQHGGVLGAIVQRGVGGGASGGEVGRRRHTVIEGHHDVADAGNDRAFGR